jgi:2,3-bisphosphoglycerate-dependent phosphoglycerate mutase
MNLRAPGLYTDRSVQSHAHDLHNWTVLVRHGATVVDAARPASTWVLSDAGRDSVAALARRLRQLDRVLIVCSPEPKARQTAELIRPHGEICLDDDLREHGVGQVPFLSADDFDRAVMAFFEQPQVVAFGSESAAAAAQRMERAVARLHGASAIVVSHGRIISAYVSTLLGSNGLSIWRALKMPDVLLVNPVTREVRPLSDYDSAQISD